MKPSAVQPFGRCAALALVCAFSAIPGAAAQNPPTTEQARQILQQRPELGPVIRQRIGESGLTPDQVRARLVASGYPANLLDAYLGAETANAPSPDADVLQAMRLLGMANAEELQGMAATVPPAPAQQGPGLHLFGLDVFQRVTTQFLPSLAGPVDANYRLGAGDMLVLILTGDVELAHTLEVTREGFVVIPQVGQLFVQNLTLDELRSLLYARLGRVYSGVKRGAGATTKFEVTVARVRVVQVFVLGEVTRPGSFQIPSVGTALTALYEAGGPTERGNFRQVEIRRRGAVVATIDLYDYLLRGAAEGDIRLETGDVVFLPLHGTRASVDGAVVRPAIYELKPGQTLADLIETAGGFSPEAALLRISIARIVPPAQRTAEGPDRIVVDVPIEQVVSGRAPPFPLEPGDAVTVFSVPDVRRALVELKGGVYHPGTYGWRPGLKLSELIALAGGFRPAVYAGRAHIDRLNPADRTRFLVDVELPRDSLSPYPKDMALEDYDVVTVYGREEFRQERYVAIAGMVNAAGRYPFRDGMTLRDLVLMARGLKDGAYLDTAEVARLPADRTGGRLAYTIRVGMDSTYLFERDSTSYRFVPGLPVPASGAPEVELVPFDQVVIMRQPDFDYQRVVTISGEVRFPGSYALTNKNERLSDIFKRVGGLQPTAYPEGTRFTRQLNNAGRVNVDVPRALEHPGGQYDIILQPGDVIDVPEYQPIVRVSGAVTSPASVLWERGKGFNYYIANAGGFARNADKGRTSVHYANGSAETRSKFLLWSSWPDPGPGSEIIVPVKPEKEGTNWVPVFASIVSMLASTAAIVVAVIKL